MTLMQLRSAADMSTAPPVVFVPDITARIDSLYFGVLLSTLLFGVSIVQGWNYANTNNDQWHGRLFVATLYLLDFAITGLFWHVVRLYVISPLVDPTAVLLPLELPITAIAALSLTAAVILLARLFFASRLYLFNKNNMWPPAIVSTSAIGTFVALAVQVHVCLNDRRIIRIRSIESQLCIGLGVGLGGIADLVTVIVLFRRLSHAHSDHEKTQTVVQKLLLSISTRGLLGTGNQLLFVIVYVATLTKIELLYWTPFLLFLSKLHVMTTVAMLNARTSSNKNVMLTATGSKFQPHRKTQRTLHMKCSAVDSCA